eukprot:3043039-Rhodomonas_salina.2
MFAHVAQKHTRVTKRSVLASGVGYTCMWIPDTANTNIVGIGATLVPLFFEVAAYLCSNSERFALHEEWCY